MLLLLLSLSLLSIVRKTEPATNNLPNDKWGVLSSKISNFGAEPHHRHLRHHQRRAVTARKERVWDFGVIPYEIDGHFSGGQKALFKQAMRHWENSTCVKFVERNEAEHPNYIYFTERACGCCSFVGKQGKGEQAISIGKDCDKFGIVVHELGHVVGFWHEHTRPDRDHHVGVIHDHIIKGQEYNFDKLLAEEINSLGQPYDYESIMHYAKSTFAKGPYMDTIQPLDHHGRIEIGQRLRLSEGDIIQTNLLYKCPECGRTLQENRGSFFHAATKKGQGVRCEWRITATQGEKIVLNVSNLDLFGSENCETDYLEIIDGYWQKSPVIERLCGKIETGHLITSTGSRLTLSLVTTYRSANLLGFSASYEAVCGGNIFLEASIKGHLESPNFPEEYQPGKECVWNLEVKEGYQIALKFQAFEVENHENCVYDYVQVRDGHSSSSPIIGTFCGYKLPPDLKSTSNTLSVKFVSDGSVQKAGFSANFILEQDECSVPGMERCEQLCFNTLGGYECGCRIGYDLQTDGHHCEQACGGVIETINGTLTSPSYPDVYPKNKSCLWEIVAPPLHRVILNFTHFDFEGNDFSYDECEYDSVEVFSKMADDGLLRHGVFCGTRAPPLLTSVGNRLRVVFTSDGNLEKTGFEAYFFTDVDECAVNNGGCHHDCQNTIGSFVCSCFTGFNLHQDGRHCTEGDCKYEITTPHGEIESPYFPDKYPNNTDCVWKFTTTPGHRILLEFTHFDLERHQECAYDHISIHDGDSADGYNLGKFCGRHLPHHLESSANQMYLAFMSDASVERRGFHAVHDTVCGGFLQASNEEKYLFSHASYGEDNYPEETYCEWSIEASSGLGVRLKFIEFDLEEEPGCNNDYVEIVSGSHASGAVLGQFCGNSKPSVVDSLHETLVVRFHSDESVVAKGWSATYILYDPADEYYSYEDYQDADYTTR